MKKKIEVPWYIDIPSEAHCPRCKENSIELYDSDGYAKGYKRLLRIYKDDKPLIGNLFNDCELYIFQCTKCGTYFRIGWDFGYPVPILYE